MKIIVGKDFPADPEKNVQLLDDRGRNLIAERGLRVKKLTIEVRPMEKPVAVLTCDLDEADVEIMREYLRLDAL